LEVHEEDRSRLSAAELEQGWRLACRAHAETDLKLELAQWDTAVLTDESSFEFIPRPGFGIAIDLGTTTVAAQLLDLQTGKVLAVRTALNAQARHGADIMSRVEFAVTEGGQGTLQALIREQINGLVEELIASGTSPEIRNRLESVVVVGNTVMHHLFCGFSVEPLSHYPFEPVSIDLKTFCPKDLGWQLPSDAKIHFLPCLGGFVGSDILAGILATGLHQRNELSLLIDLGTNGEIVLGNADRLLCAATAAGPAFEGARISMGMRAATGAISQVEAFGGRLQCHVLGGVQPRGICGSGLVDAAAASLGLGWLLPNGRLVSGQSLELIPPVLISQKDVRELQLAKGAIAAGIRLLLQQWGATYTDVSQVFLAGAFGNYINQSNARRIGLLRFSPEQIEAAGNTALLGAKLALFDLPRQDLAYPQIRSRTSHLSLNELPAFQDIYVEEMVLQ
jgi:uncharacterized 2Fe-2S/4Fe-4S cluster protein (DUF4445 family)